MGKIDTLIRDITKVGWMSKSEARRRIEDLLEEQKKDIVPKERNFEHKNQKTNIRARLCQWFDNGYNECIKDIKKKYE